MKALFTSILLFLFFSFVNTTIAADYYWIGGKGEWADTSHWSSSSGGPIVYSQIPGPTDDVYIDLNSGLVQGDTIFTYVISTECRHFTLDSLPFTLIFWGGDIELYGNLYFESPVDFGFVSIEFNAPYTTSDIYAPYTSFYALEIRAGNVTINLNSDLYITDHFDVVYDSSTFNSNNHNLFWNGNLYLQDGNFFNLGTSTIYLIDVIVDWNLQETLNITSANIVLIRSWIFVMDKLRLNNLFIDNYSMADFTYSIYANEVTQQGYLYLNTGGGQADTIHKWIMELGCEVQYMVTDTLIINIVPGISPVLYFETLTVNDYIEVNGTPGNDVYMSDYMSSGSCTLYLNMPLACLDYLTLGQVDVMGSGQYYAGIHSTGSGNNWIWSGCSPAYSNVWPGDANDDLVVDMQDFLYLGLGNQQSGPARDSISIFYAANNVMNWYSFFPNGLNYKHADCNGDSTIALDDTSAIVQNYGLTHPAFAQNYNPLPLAGTSATLDLGLPSLLTPGMTYQVPILLGDSINFLMDVHGIAFRLMYNPNLIVPASVDILFGPSWLANSGQSINFRKNNAAGAYIDFAITRFNGTNATGGGRIAYLVFTVKPGVNGNAAFQFLKPLAVNAAQQQLLLNPGNTTISTLVGMNDINHSAGPLLISPNPARSFITVATTTAFPFGTAEVFSATGQLLQAPLMSRTENELMLDISALEPGYYLLRLNNQKSVTTTSFIVQ